MYEQLILKLCCSKLALMTDDGNMTDRTFQTKYHDIPDVLDFIVLKQTFKQTFNEKFNEKHSNIQKHARIITDLCWRILR
jgi:hypothetical protein